MGNRLGRLRAVHHWVREGGEGGREGGRGRKGGREGEKGGREREKGRRGVESLEKHVYTNFETTKQSRANQINSPEEVFFQRKIGCLRWDTYMYMCMH